MYVETAVLMVLEPVPVKSNSLFYSYMMQLHSESPGFWILTIFSNSKQFENSVSETGAAFAFR
jgi:hypothetical protein